MFSTPAFAQTTAPAGGGTSLIFQMAPLLAIFVLFYFMIIRPQQKRAKQHQAMVMGVKRGDTVVLSNGMIGKVIRVEDTEVGVEIAPGVNTKVVKSMISDVRVKGDVAAANDGKA